MLPLALQMVIKVNNAQNEKRMLLETMIIFQGRSFQDTQLKHSFGLDSFRYAGFHTWRDDNCVTHELLNYVFSSSFTFICILFKHTGACFVIDCVLLTVARVIF